MILLPKSELTEWAILFVQVLIGSGSIYSLYYCNNLLYSLLLMNIVFAIGILKDKFYGSNC